MSTFQLIRDVRDSRLDSYRDVRERDLVGRQGMFVAEGELVVRMLVRSRLHRIHSLLCLEARTGRLADVAAALPPQVSAYSVPREVLDAVAGFPVHRGVLAIGERGGDRDADALLSTMPDRSVVLALCGISNHDNVGALFRNSAAFGVGAILLDGASCDPLYRKAIRVSMGHALSVPFARGGSACTLLDALVRHRFDPVALAPSGATLIGVHGWQTRTALLLGAEGVGLPSAVLDRGRPVAIPMAPGIDSLNVATAAGIALHAAWTALKT